MKIGFATDIHLDHIKENADLTKHRRIGKNLADGLGALLISGDICNGIDFSRQFGAFHEGADIPVYFVLGNHDFWGAEDIQVRNNAAQFPGYLDRGQVVELVDGVGLCGRTGFYDTLTGNPFESRWHMNDWDRIPRLAGCWRVPQLLQRECKAWAEEETEKAVRVLREAVKGGFKEVYFLTHFPLFTEACFHGEDGELDVEENGMWPWSIDTTMGHAVREIAAENPGVSFTIFTGHTHGGGEKQISTNLRCVAGKARYGSPSVSKIWEI